MIQTWMKEGQRVLTACQDHWRGMCQASPAMAAKLQRKPWMTRCNGFDVFRLLPRLEGSMHPATGLHELQGASMLAPEQAARHVDIRVMHVSW